MWVIIFIIFGSMVATWFGWTFYIISNLDKPKYKIDQVLTAFEVRSYEPYTVAEVIVTGNYNRALREGFQILADYIFGSNTQAAHIEMSAPVTEQLTQVSEPETDTAAAIPEAHTIRFAMPKDYTLKDLPLPHNKRIELKELPPQKVAVLKFGWYATADRVDRKKSKLVDAAHKAGFVLLTEPIYATYNDPYSFPLLQKHEIWLPIN